MQTLRIALANSDAAFMGKVSDLLSSWEQTVVGELTTGADAVSTARQLEPDVLLLDMHLPDMSGLEVLERIRGVGQTHSIAVVDTLEVDEMTHALMLGASGAILKTATAPTLFKCLRAVVSGELWFPRDVTKALLRYVEQDAPARHSGSVLKDRLTARETDVLQAVANGMPNREIADRLQISEYTVKHHLSRIFAKLSVSNRVELALLASKYEL